MELEAHVGSHVVAAKVPWVVVLDSRGGMSGAATGGGQSTGRAATGGTVHVVMAVLDAKLVVVTEIVVVLEGWVR